MWEVRHPSHGALPGSPRASVCSPWMRKTSDREPPELDLLEASRDSEGTCHRSAVTRMGRDVNSCARCGSQSEDLRTLYMRCLYDMSELKIPFVNQELLPGRESFYTLLVCKSCRASWMEAIQNWFFSPPPQTEECDAYRNVLKNSCFCWQEWNDNAPGPCNVCEVLSRFEKEGK